MFLRKLLFSLFLISTLGHALAEEPALEATTAAGEKVRLFSNGRWEYAEQKKAEAQREQRRGVDEREAGAQGGFLGLGRKIYPGDKEYNRGSLNPKTR